jgi:hypothetical protein
MTEGPEVETERLHETIHEELEREGGHPADREGHLAEAASTSSGACARAAG